MDKLDKCPSVQIGKYSGTRRHCSLRVGHKGKHKRIWWAERPKQRFCFCWDNRTN